MTVLRHRLTSAVLGALLLCLAVVVAVIGPPAPARAADAGGSAVTVAGTGDFAGLRVTVSQTRNLVNQVLRVSWSGGAPTQPAFTSFGVDFLQIMQCWSTDDTGPSREQCQFGGIGAVSAAGQNVASRQITLPAGTVADAAELQYPGPPGTPNVYVPFFAANGQKSEGPSSSFFDINTTNAIPLARTRADGSGEAYFEAQTGVEAPGLGCGQVQKGRTEPYPCWLVVVPRSDKEVDGSLRNASPDVLISSPLSQTNWDQRIEIPLGFAPVGGACRLGGAERPMAGTEMVGEAVGRWQPTLCGDGERNFGYSEVSDDVARRTLLSDSPGLTFMSRGVPKDRLGGATPIYAPVSVSGITVAFNIESQSSTLAPDAVRRRDGQRLTSMKLTPRLLLKILSQSYGYDAGDPKNVRADNPWDLSKDPEFLQLNPQFRGLFIPSLAGVLLPLGNADTIAAVWAYIGADAEAHAFLAGKPDPWGMTINTTYKGMSIEGLTTYPRSDLACRTQGDIPVPTCTLDKIPFADNMFQASRAASRGDSLSRLVWDGTASPPTWKKSPLQDAGMRALIAVVDTATAERFGLSTAALRNQAGAFVAPSTSSLRAGVATMVKDASTGLLVPDPRARSAAAYPLASVAYAATVPAAIDKDAGADYARFVRYAAGRGQTPGYAPGTLPDGYAPLPARLAAQAAAAAATIERTAGVPVTASPAPSGSRHGEGDGGNSGGQTAGTGTVPVVPGEGDASASPVTSTHPSAAPTPSASGLPAPSASAVVATAPTPEAPVGPSRTAAVAALALGGTALVGRAALPWIVVRPGR